MKFFRILKAENGMKRITSSKKTNKSAILIAEATANSKTIQK